MKHPVNEIGRVLVLAPTGNDARLTRQVLENADIQAKLCKDVAELCVELEGPCAAIILAEETLRVSAVLALAETLSKQPAWSDIPLTIITSGGETDRARLRRLAVFGPRGNVTLLERPFRPGTLVSTIEAALRTRVRQYQVKELLGELGSARDAAEKASRAKDDFLAALSHELRTPLNPVLLLATEAATNTTLPEELRSDFDMIAKNVALEARLIDDLLDLTRITRGKLILETRPTPLHGIIRDAIANVRGEMLEKRLLLSIDLLDSDPIVDCDPVRMQQVFWNILKNAAKFTEPEGQINVSTRIESLSGVNNMAVVISDNGVGMSPNEIARVFDAFAQGDHAQNANLHRFGGLGLGLAISRRLIELHSGTISAASDGPGTGSTFTIRIPIKTENAKATGAVRPPDHNTHGLRILLVEDHEPTRMALARLLEARKHFVASANSVSEARRIGSGQPFDLLISDLGLPDGSGYELMEDLGKAQGVKGIAITGYGSEAHLERAHKAGFKAHVVKPVSVRALDSVLESIWER